jgi:cytochrome c oxidase assembly factor CtaG
MIGYLPIALTCAALGLFLLGERRAVVITGRPRSPEARRRARFFYAGCAVILFALESPVDSISDKLFSIHMLQHLLLLVVAAPLIAAARPWMSIWRPLPLGFRRSLLRWGTNSATAAPLRVLWHAISGPIGAWVLFCGAMVVWHIPGLYDATLRDLGVHVLEHTLFICFGILFWSQVFALPPAHRRLTTGQRALYALAAIIPNMALSVFLVYTPHALYSPYVHVNSRPLGLTAYQDQQIGGGLMWTLGDFPYVIAVALLAIRWMVEHERASTTPEGMLATALRRGASARS